MHLPAEREPVLGQLHADGPRLPMGGANANTKASPCKDQRLDLTEWSHDFKIDSALVPHCGHPTEAAI